MSDLKVCAHCGTNSAEIKKCLGEKWVQCMSCGIETDLYNTRSEAIKIWNARANPWIEIKPDDVIEDIVFVANLDPKEGDGMRAWVSEVAILDDMIMDASGYFITHYMLIPEVSQ